MDKYQSYIKTGEPVVLLNPGKYGSSIGTFICQHPAVEVPGVTAPHCTDWTTDSIINVGEDGEHNPFVIPDCEWVRVDPESSLYKIIMWKRRGSMFQMHQLVDIIDGFYRGKIGFINGIHVDVNTNEYVVRLNSEDPENPSVRPTEVTVPGWCLATHVHGRFDDKPEDTPKINEEDYRKVLGDVIFEIFRKVIGDKDIKFAIRHEIEDGLAELIANNMSGVMSSAVDKIFKVVDRNIIVATLQGLPQYDEFFKVCSDGLAQHILSNKCKLDDSDHNNNQDG